MNLGAASAAEVNKALAGQGYEIATESTLDVEQIETLGPELMITEATPSDLSCCGVITQIKSREKTKSIRVLMVVQGGALERARALDLGADDVISSPFEPLEFAARVRTQFRERQPEEDLRSKLKLAEEKEHLAELAVETLSGGAVTRKRMWVLPAILALCVIAVLATLVTSFSDRRSRSDTLQLKAEVARLSRGVVQQSDLLRRAEDQRRVLDAQGKTDSATRESLVAQSADLKKKMAAAGGSGDSDLRKQLVETEGRLNRLESEGKFAETVVRTYGSSVCLLHVVVEFLDHGSGKPILIAVDQLGKPILDEKGMVQLDVNGSGPHLQLDVFGTGFLVRKDGRLVTNHHVAEPWWGNDELKTLIDHGASAYALSYTAYFPGNMLCKRARRRMRRDRSAFSVHRCPTRVRRRDGWSPSVHLCEPETPCRKRPAADAARCRSRPTAPCPFRRVLVCRAGPPQSESAFRFRGPETPPPRATSTR